ncbi:hypothetical protein GCM10028778_22500 [Barrientosiimonas marina]|uniref:TIGR04104 family putative zinc finger protein n=1 Tax=Lentibacillus kimchii TaxID=1542911 RepID=A0ABW2UYD0_9BACI
MPTCENCHNTWSWKQTMKKMFTLDPGMNCPYCGERQYQTRKSKNKAGFLNAFVFLPIFLNIFFDIPAAILISLFLVLTSLVISLHPVVMHLSNKEEYSF